MRVVPSPRDLARSRRCLDPQFRLRNLDQVALIAREALFYSCGHSGAWELGSCGQKRIIETGAHWNPILLRCSNLFRDLYLTNSTGNLPLGGRPGLLPVGLHGSPCSSGNFPGDAASGLGQQPEGWVEKSLSSRHQARRPFQLRRCQ